MQNSPDFSPYKVRAQEAPKEKHSEEASNPNHRSEDRRQGWDNRGSVGRGEGSRQWRHDDRVKIADRRAATWSSAGCRYFRLRARVFFLCEGMGRVDSCASVAREGFLTWARRGERTRLREVAAHF